MQRHEHDPALGAWRGRGEIAPARDGLFLEDLEPRLQRRQLVGKGGACGEVLLLRRVARNVEERVLSHEANHSPSATHCVAG